MLRFINKLEEGIISLLLASMTLLVFVEVLLRFVFSTGLLWAQELTLLLSAWMVLFGASYGIKVGSHIGVDAAVRLLSPAWRRIVGVLSVALCLVYCGLFLNGSWGYLSKLYSIHIMLEDVPLPKWFAYSILIYGLVMITVRLVILGVGIIQGKAEGFKHLDEAKESMHLIEETKKHSESFSGGMGGDRS
ncbi:MAG: TRAP transporter small permease [Desulfovibrionaceae bacterium]